MARTYTRREVKQLLAALERQVREAMKLAKAAEIDAGKESFNSYRAFRDKVGEFQALVILIENRLKNLMDSRVEDLQQEFERLDTLMLSILVRASMRFFFVLSAKTALPLGAREIFVSELHSLHDAHKKLKSPHYAGKLDERVEQDLNTASEILEEIIEKAPGLLNFNAPLPSEELSAG